MSQKVLIGTLLVLLWTLALAPQAWGAPVPSESLKVGTVIDIGKELAARSSMYNPRSFDGKNYVAQINAPQRAVGCYPVGSTRYEALADIKDGAEVRMAGAFPAADYVLLAGGASSDFFSRIDPNLNLATRVFTTNLPVTPSSFDWVDDDTIVHTSYKSGLRNNLYLTDIKADPFQVTANTTWNANGYVAAGTTTRIRNVRVGDVYRGYAYYGDSGVNTAGFWAINLATGVPTRLGTVDVTGDGSWGVWTVKEVDGFVYIHTTHNGIYVFNLTDATTLGAFSTLYTKETLDALAEDTNPNWGFDVVEGGARMLLSAGVGRVIEIIDARTANAPDPLRGAAAAEQTSILSWSPGAAAAAHDVYFGTDSNAVADANTATADIYRGRQALDQNTFDPGPLEWNVRYFWRVDEVNDAHPQSPWVGTVWSFTTADFLTVDNFESYTDEADVGARVYETWLDGYADSSSGSTVGHLDPPFAEQTTVHSGGQSMPLNYNNLSQPFYSEAKRPWSTPQNWTVNGVDSLVLHFRGELTNTPVKLYVTLADSTAKSATVVYPDAAATAAAQWTEWKIPLASFTGVNAGKIESLVIGLGNRSNPEASGTGLLYIDDIRVVKP